MFEESKCYYCNFVFVCLFHTNDVSTLPVNSIQITLLAISFVQHRVYFSVLFESFHVYYCLMWKATYSYFWLYFILKLVYSIFSLVNRRRKVIDHLLLYGTLTMAIIWLNISNFSSKWYKSVCMNYSFRSTLIHSKFVCGVNLSYFFSAHLVNNSEYFE